MLAEYSFAGINKPIGISTYELTRALPRKLRSALPTVEEIENELGDMMRNMKPPSSPPKVGERVSRKARRGGK